jgi:hypothetical protein
VLGPTLDNIIHGIMNEQGDALVDSGFERRAAGFSGKRCRV